MRGHLVVIAGPSGSGKTTVAREILSRNPSFRFSVSATTRPIRAGEVDGKDYFFLTHAEFVRRREAGEFVESEEIYGDLYGSLKVEVERALGREQNLLFDVDVKGALSIKRQYPEAVLVFIAPPSLEMLRERLRNRHTESETTLARRMERAALELELGKQFDYRVVNDTLPDAVERVQKIVQQTMDEHLP
jgi:guanylate kinase